MGTDHEHRVCTFKEAEDAIKAHDVVYLNDCFCRTPAKQGKTKWDYCGHPVETCMSFNAPKEDEDWRKDCNTVEITREKALQIHDDWKKQGGMFRFMMDESWICCCCACGCHFFRDKDGNRTSVNTCEKGPFIQETDSDACILCGDCIEICAFEARKIDGDKMAVDSEICFGCSACEYACEQNAVTMIPRA